MFRIQNLTNALAATKAALKEQEDINAQNALRLVELSDLKAQVKRLQDSHVNTENQKARDQENYKTALARFQISLEDTTRAIESLNQDKRNLVDDLCKTQTELSRERANHQSTQNELLLTKKKLENAENYKTAIASLESQREQLNQQVAESRSSHAL